MDLIVNANTENLKFRKADQFLRLIYTVTVICILPPAIKKYTLAPYC